MRPGLVTVAVLLVAASACNDEPQREPGPEPMATPVRSSPLPSPVAAPIEIDELRKTDEPDPAPPVELPERPRADPDIEKTLDLVSSSGLRFIDQASDADAKPSEYTAEQFANVLRTKWDWIGYDLTELEPWLDEIATRSFRTNLPYQVVYADGTTGELRVWIDAKLRESATNEL